MKGRITTIKRNKGFGFIQDEAGQDRFFHANSCSTPFDQLQEGLEVEFEPYTEAVNPRTKLPNPPGKDLRGRRVTVTG